MKKLLMVSMVIGSVAVSQAQTLVDNFQSDSLGLVSGQPASGWTALGGTSPTPIDTATIQSDGLGNNFLSIGGITAGSGTYRMLPTPIATMSSGTLFFQAYANNVNLNVSIGLSDIVPTDANAFGAFEPQMRMNINGGAPRFDARASSGVLPFTTPAPITLGQWYNVWMVADTSSDTWSCYINTGTANATAGDLKMSGITFRDSTDHNTALTTILVYSGAQAGGTLSASVDNFYESSGTDLVNPVPEPSSVALVLSGFGLLMSLRRSRKA